MLPVGNETNTTSSNEEQTEGESTPTKQNPSLPIQDQPSTTQSQDSPQQNVKPVSNTQTNEFELHSTSIKAVILSCWDNTVGPKTLRIWHGMVCCKIIL